MCPQTVRRSTRQQGRPLESNTRALNIGMEERQDAIFEQAEYALITGTASASIGADSPGVFGSKQT